MAKIWSKIEPKSSTVQKSKNTLIFGLILNQINYVVYEKKFWIQTYENFLKQKTKDIQSSTVVLDIGCIPLVFATKTSQGQNTEQKITD